MELTLKQCKQKPIVLDHFICPGDRVLVTRAESHPSSDGDASLPDGTEAICVGHKRWLDYAPYERALERSPGVYERLGAAIFQYVIKDDEGHEKTILGTLSAHDLIFKDPNLDPQKTRRHTDVWNLSVEGQRIGDLPDLPLWVGDQVRSMGRLASAFSEADREGPYVIDAIEYSWLPYYGDPQKTVTYRIRPKNGGWTTSARGDELMLELRGNVYFWHNDKSKLGFSDIYEEVAFFWQLGAAVQLKNPKSGDYAWDVESVEQALKNGQGAFITNHIFTGPSTWVQRGRPLSSGGSLRFYDFPDYPILACRARAKTLQAFEQPHEYRYDN